MKLMKTLSCVFALLAVIAVVAAVMITGRALDAKPQLLRTPPDAATKVSHLMEAVQAGDYDSVSAALLGKPSLGVDREPANAVGKLVWDAFTASFSYQLDGDFYATDDGLAQDVTVEYLEISSVMGNLQERAQALLAKRVEEAEDTWEIYDEKYDYREDVVMEVLQEAVQAALQEDARRVSVNLTLNLVYRNNAWWVVADNALLGAISGNVL